MTAPHLKTKVWGMQCARCGAQLIPGKRFCPACGDEVRLHCPTCHATIEPGFRFCPDCGAPVAPQTPAAPPHPAGDRLHHLSRHIPADLAEKIRASSGTIAGERKLVTVLFCDLVGSTAIAEHLDPEEYRDLLDEYLELAFREVYRFDGIVNQLAGDGFMALFGAPVAHENAPNRAVLAAMAIREATQRLSQQLRAERDLDLRVRIGIHAGPVVVGTVGNDLKMDYTAIGDTTNLAARLETLAAPDTIVMSEQVHRLVLGFFHVRPVGPFTVKGRSEPVTAYEVQGQRGSATPIGIAVARGLTPLVGRSELLTHLRACYHGLAGHLAQVVAVVGDAGSGKSRLLYEFKQGLGGEPTALFEARCSSLSSMLPYAPIVDMLRGYLEIATNEPPANLCKKIAGGVRPWDEALDRIYPFLCRLLAAPVESLAELPAAELKHETFEAVARLVLAVSEQTPVVMIIEDLQWSDELSRELLKLAFSRLHRSRIMLVVSHRPDHELSWQTPAAFTRLTLPRLSDEDIASMVRAIAGGSLPAGLEQRILSKAEGNPFFAEELTRALVEDGHVLPADGSIRLTRPVGEIPIPDTVQELIGARLDRLGSHAKRVVQVAAVFGRQFERGQLTSLLEGDGTDVVHGLEELERRGVIHRKSMLSNDEFRFGESLTQEVAYQNLLLKERRRLHGRIAAMFEAMAGEGTPDQAPLIAHHYTRSESQDKAIEALLRAARAAERAPSYSAGVELYRQAWQLAETALARRTVPEERARRWALEATYGLSRLTILYGSVSAADCEPAARRGRELAEGLGDLEAVAYLCALDGMRTLGEDRAAFDRGLGLVEQGLEVARGAGLAAPAVSISRSLAWGYLLDGRLAAALDTIEWVMQELDRSGDRRRLADVYFGARWVRDTVTFYSDDFAEALRGAAETNELALRARNRTAESGSAARLGHLHLLRGDYAAARQWGDRAISVAEEIGNVASILTAAAVVLAVRSESGEPAGRYTALAEHALETGNHILLNGRLVVEAFLAAGELQRAERCAEEAYRRAGGRLREALSTSALGDVMLRRGPAYWDAAARWYGRAIQLADDIGAHSALAVARLGAAELAVARGDHRGGADAIAKALETCRGLGLGHYRRRAERLLASLGSPPVGEEG